MSLTGSMLNGLSGMTANGRQAEATSNNLANALTKGFTTKTTSLTSRSLGGVAVANYTRAEAPELTAARRSADADAAAFEPQSTALDRLASALGEVGDEDSLGNRVQSFEASLRALAETPESTPLQTDTVDKARDLASFVSDLAETVRIERQVADKAIATDVATVNRNVAQIDKINARLALLGADNRETISLVDQRELLIDEVSAIIPVRALDKENNGIYLVTAQGQFLLGDDPKELQFTRSPIITNDMTYDPTGGGLSGLTLDGEDITPTSGNRFSITDGSLVGNFTVRDSITTDMMSQIDLVAFDLIERFADPAIDPTNTTGAAGLFTDGGAAAVPADAEGVSATLSISALVDPLAGGDPARLRDGLFSAAPGPATSDTVPRGLLNALRDQKTTTGLGIAGALNVSGVVSTVTEYTASRRVALETETAIRVGTRETLALSEAEIVSVDQDQELQRLLQIEQAFAANVQVVQAAARMMQEILEIR